MKIDQDHRRFKQIVKGKVRDNLKKYISQGDLIAHQGQKKISIPIHSLNLPSFSFGEKDRGGVGKGKGKPGDPIGPTQPGAGQGGEAGTEEGEHAIEIEFTVEELAQILGDELELPKLEPRGTHSENLKNRYTGISTAGPESLRHFKRTYKKSLRRLISTGEYNPDSPVIIPIHSDKVYRSAKKVPNPNHNAVIIFMMDASGSMGNDQRDIVRIESYWISTWLKSQYDGLKERWIVHDSKAAEVDEDTFFRTNTAGGTTISAAYELCANIIDKDYPVSDWNIYPIHFSDGDNSSFNDSSWCAEILRKRVLPKANVFCYGQIKSPFGSGKFIEVLRDKFKKNDQVITSQINNKDEIMRSIKDFLGKGK